MCFGITIQVLRGGRDGQRRGHGALERGAVLLERADDVGAERVECPSAGGGAEDAGLVDIEHRRWQEPRIDLGGDQGKRRCAARRGGFPLL
jgi:hypothetical protein